MDGITRSWLAKEANVRNIQEYLTMTTSRKHPEKEPARFGRPPNIPEALKLIEHWLETDERNPDTSDWEHLKKLLDEDRLSERKLFADE